MADDEEPTPLPLKMSGLFEDGNKRQYTLNADAKTYEIISAVSEQTSKSRPQVLAAFVEMAYHHYVKQAESHEIDPTEAASGRHRGARKKKTTTKKKKTKKRARVGTPGNSAHLY